MQGVLVKVANLTDLLENIGKTVHLHDQEIAIFRLEDGSVHAIENRCPHKGGPLSEGMISGKHVFCPLHDWKISLGDGRVQSPDIGCVKTFEVSVEDEDIYIRL